MKALATAHLLEAFQLVRALLDPLEQVARDTSVCRKSLCRDCFDGGRFRLANECGDLFYNVTS